MTLQRTDQARRVGHDPDLAVSRCANDQTANNHHGTFVGGLTFTGNSPVNDHPAMGVFDGTGVITVPDHTSATS